MYACIRQGSNLLKTQKSATPMFGPVHPKLGLPDLCEVSLDPCPRAPSTQIMSIMGPTLCRCSLLWAAWNPRVRVKSAAEMPEDKVEA